MASGPVKAMRAAAKRVAETALVAGGVARRARARNRRHAAILAYHNVVPDDEPPVGDRSLHLSRDHFAAQLDRLMVTHRIVPLTGLLAERTGGEGPAAAITFDDAYAGVFEVALPELKRRGLPATVFVAPGLLGEKAFWWDLLADPESGRVAPQVRRRALEEHRGVQERILAVEGPSQADPPRLFRSATERQIEEAVSYTGLTLASHTWKHPNLTRLTSGEIKRELERSRAWLEARFDSVVTGVAYPYGLHSPEVQDAVKGTEGYAFGLQGGLCAPGQLEVAPLGLPRINVPAGVSLRGFELRAAGVLVR